MSFDSSRFSLHSDREVSAPEPKRRRLEMDQKSTNGAGLEQHLFDIAPDMSASTIFVCLEEIFAKQPSTRIQNINELISRLQKLKEKLERERNEKYRLNTVSTDDEDIEVVEIEPRRKTGLITVIDVDPPTNLPSTSKSYTPTETITIHDPLKVPALVAAPPIAASSLSTPPIIEGRRKSGDEEVPTANSAPVEHEFAKPKLRPHLSEPARQSTKSPTMNRDQNGGSGSNALRDKTPLKATHSLEENRQLLEKLRRENEETQRTDVIKQQVLETMYSIIGRDASEKGKEDYLRQIRVPVKQDDFIIQVDNPFLSLKKSPIPSSQHSSSSPSTSIMLPPPIRQTPPKTTPTTSGVTQIMDTGVAANNISLRQGAMQFGIVPEPRPLGASPHSQIPFTQPLTPSTVFMPDPKNPGFHQLFIATSEGYIPAASGSSWVPTAIANQLATQTSRIAPPAKTSMMTPPQPIMRKSGLANMTPPKGCRKVSFIDDCATEVLDKGKVPASPLIRIPIRVSNDGVHMVEVPRPQNRWSIVSLSLPCTLHLKCKCPNK